MGLVTNIAIAGAGIGAIVAALVIFRTSIISALQAGGQTVGESFGGFFGGIGQGITESFSRFEFPSFDFSGNGGNGGVGTSGIAGETVPLGTEGDLVIIPEDTMITPEGTVESETPPILVPSDATIDLIRETQEASALAGEILEEFPAREQLILLNEAIDATALESFENLRRLALESISPVEEFQGIGFFDLPQTERIEALPLSQAAFDFFVEEGVTPIRVGGA